MKTSPHKKTIAFLGSKEVGMECFRVLVDYVADHDAEIVAVCPSPRGHELRDFAESKGFNVIEDLDDLPECDVLISIQFHEILKKRHLERAKDLAVNLHMAPLPEYRGCNQFSLAIINEDEEYGVTLHEMVQGVDCGDILFEERFAIDRGIWVEDLIAKAAQESVKLFKANIAKLVTSSYPRISQEELVKERGTSFHYRNEINDLKRIDLNWPKEKIERAIRATYRPSFGPPFCEIDGNVVELVLAGDWEKSV